MHATPSRKRNGFLRALSRALRVYAAEQEQCVAFTVEQDTQLREAPQRLRRCAAHCSVFATEHSGPYALSAAQRGSVLAERCSLLAAEQNVRAAEERAATSSPLCRTPKRSADTQRGAALVVERRVAKPSPISVASS